MLKIFVVVVAVVAADFVNVVAMVVYVILEGILNVSVIIFDSFVLLFLEL